MIWLILAVIIILILLHQFWYRRRNLPDGPIPIFFMGNMLTLWNLDRLEYKFLEWRDKYGDIFTYWLGPLPIVTVNSYKKAVELFVKDGDSFSERMSLENLLIKTRGGIYGIIDTNGDLWREQRRFALTTLRNFGMGKNKLQERILEEVQTICESINKDIDKGIFEHDFHKYTDLATGSVINAIVNGYRFSGSDKEEEFYRMKEITEKIMHSFSDPLLVIGLASDYLADFPIIRPKFQRLLGLFKEVFVFLDATIDEHSQQNDYNQDFEPRDLIDAFLLEMNRCEEKKEAHYFSKEQLRAVVFDLWMAGQETTSTTITWSIAYLICDQEVQDKLHAELDNVIGSDRMITVADKIQLHYTQAVTMETQRMANIIPSNLLRKVTRDIEIDGCHIKKGTIMIPQISTIMTFPNPKRFNPSRFIDENGHFKPAEEVIPFSLGKRACMGESFAKMELFLILANLFNQYKFLPGKNPPTLKKINGGVSMGPQIYKCRLERRF